jgi:hypothetical protein
VAGLAVALSTAGVLGASCSRSQTSSADSAFVGAVHQGAPDIGSYRSDTELIRLGHAACDDFRSGASYEEIADRLLLQEGSKPLPSEDLGVVISSAVQAYCPKFESDVS